MNESKLLNISLLGIITLFSTFPVYADTADYRLIVRPRSRITDIPVSMLCENMPRDQIKKAKLAILEANHHISFYGQNTRIRIKDSVPILPRLRVDSRGITYTAQLKLLRGKSCTFKIYSPTSRPLFTNILSKVDQYKGFILDKGKNWILANESEEKLLQSGFNQDGEFSDIGSIQKFVNGQAVKAQPRFVCARPFIPGTRWSSGQVIWNVRDPRRAGFSIKDENNSSGYVSSLRCPKGPGKTEYRVDGAYQRKLPLLALKVPDHCTATVRRTGKYSHAWDCCCTASLVPLKGSCRYINATALPDWPNQGRVCR